MCPLSCSCRSLLSRGGYWRNDSSILFLLTCPFVHLFCRYSAAQDSLRVYGWEPFVCFDKKALPWGAVHEVAVNGTRLLAGSIYQQQVSLWEVRAGMFFPELPSPSHLLAFERHAYGL